MQRYLNLDGKSGIEAFELGLESITVRFSDGWHYLYDYASTGETDVNRMADLALAGRGLNSFISTTVKKRYARKWR